MRLTTRLEIKSIANMQFDGHASVFGNEDLGGDVVLPGAFARTLARHKSEGTTPAMFWMHDQTRIPGKWLDMHEDESGLMTKGELAPTDLGKEVHTLLTMEAVRGLSIGYLPKEVEYGSDGVRLLKEVELLEVSIVAIPMNPRAQIAHVKARLSERGEYVPTDKEFAELKREAEHFLRTRGFSRGMAMQCAKNLFYELLVEESAKQSPGIDLRREAEDQTSKSQCVTPDELEVAAGMQSFRERMLSRDLERRFARIFPK